MKPQMKLAIVLLAGVAAAFQPCATRGVRRSPTALSAESESRRTALRRALLAGGAALSAPRAPALAEDLDDLSPPTPEEEEKERLRRQEEEKQKVARKLALQQAAGAGPKGTLSETMEKEQEKQKEARQKTKKQKQEELCELLGRGC